MATSLTELPRAELIDIIRASDDVVKDLRAELAAKDAAHAAEIDEFNAGYDAAKRGAPIENEPSETPYDVWRVGWVWGTYQKGKS